MGRDSRTLRAGTRQEALFLPSFCDIRMVFAVVVIGGMGSIMGSVVTGFILGLLEGLTKVFYPEASNIGENVAYGYASPLDILNQFLCDRVHRSGLAEVELSDIQRAEARRLLSRRGGTWMGSTARR